MPNDNRIQLGQLYGAKLTYECPDGTKETVHFDEKEKDVQSKKDDEHTTLSSIKTQDRSI